MLLSKKTTLFISDNYLPYITTMCYAASKLWNIGNYERLNFRKFGYERSPHFYDQNKKFKDNRYYKLLPSSVASNVLFDLHGAWKAFFAAKYSQSIDNVEPPRFKFKDIPVTFSDGSLKKDGAKLRLTISKLLKEEAKEQHGLEEKFLYLENKVFGELDNVKQVKVYPPDEGCNKIKVVVVYEVPDAFDAFDCGRYFSIDLGLHNLMTCLDCDSGYSFILGRKYWSICRKYDKELKRVQTQWFKQQTEQGIEYPKASRHMKALLKKRENETSDYLHKITRFVVDYCVRFEIHVVVIGDVNGILKQGCTNAVTNQKMHEWPFDRIYQLLEYKLKREGIYLVRQKETYSSQCSAKAPEVSADYARPWNRVQRGLYKDGKDMFNADVNGAYNIFRLYCQQNDVECLLKWEEINTPRVIKV